MHHTTEAGCFPATGIWSPAGYTEPSMLPTGVWNVMANGRIQHLNLIDVSGSTVTGEYNRLPIECGRWDGKVLTFIRVETRGIDLRQVFTGYLMAYVTPDPERWGPVSPDYNWRIAGVFGKEGLAEPQAGWYATRPRET
ncbi:MAG: hypothetical protein H6645_04235 [Caldilineaceae bacterium]|nr:hypothetical protein [Caldilineaceae bacterium]